MSAAGDNSIFLRAFAAVGDEVAAGAICFKLERTLSCHGKIICHDPPQRYWKIPEYWEIFVEFRPEKPLPVAFDDVTRELASGWEIHAFSDSGSWAVWNARPESTFVVPEVRWAHLECLRRSVAGPDSEE